MAKRSKNKPQKQQKTAVSSVMTPEPPEVGAVTVEDVQNSVSEEEFEEKKAALISGMRDELGELEKRIRDSDIILADLRNKEGTQRAEIDRVAGELDKVRNEYERVNAEYNDIKGKLDDVRKESGTIRQEADEYSKKVREDADRERIERLCDADREARSIWQKKVDELSGQIKELADRETALREAKRKLELERQDVEDDRYAIEEMKLSLQRQKERYDAANPIKLAALETELEDERDRYGMIRDHYAGLQKRFNSLQAFVDTVSAEITEGNEKKTLSLGEIISELHELREKDKKLSTICERYPDLGELEKRAEFASRLEAENERLRKERDEIRSQLSYAERTSKELETARQEVAATNALNEHLLKELESHKTALESRTGDTCPSLSNVDVECGTERFRQNIEVRMRRPELRSLREIVSHVKNFAGSCDKLYYTDNDIRAFLAGMAVSRLMILQGMSGTGKSSLPRVFAKAISGFDRLIPVESSWRDRNELLGYYNDFNKKFNAKSFTIELYRSGKEICRQIPTFIVLDEMNLSRIEYYFSDFLAILQEPNPEKWLIELVSSDMRTLPMALPVDAERLMMQEDRSVYDIWERLKRSRKGDLLADETTDEEKERLKSYLARHERLTGAKDLVGGRKLKVTDNIWFVGTANRDESTFEISDKVYDRAQVVSLNKKGVPEKEYAPTAAKFISVEKLEALFSDAIANNPARDETIKRLNAIDNVLMDKFNLSFGNRIVSQTIDFAGVFIAAGGSLTNALDYQISTKILRKVITSDDDKAFAELRKVASDYPETMRLIGKRMDELR